MKEIKEWVTGKVSLTIGGKPINMEMTVPKDPVTVRRMLPVFRQLTNSFVGIGVGAAEADGKEISCKAGCGACCRQPVPLAETEVFELAELVENMPEPRRTEIKERFDKAFEHFASKGWFEKLDGVASMDKSVRHEIAIEYFSEQIACPFLEDESCSIHENRPVACREYLVTSPAEHCSSPTADTIEMVPILAKPSVALCRITQSTTKGTSVRFVPLITALEIARNYEEDQTEKSGEEWMADFFTELTHQEIPRENTEK
ncbi:MAG: YkgJ family cysteine cluster protein [Pyrinomonadaceae bacterium]|nr:YkgJ family cysteine cluster protein [Pyrinomonadaceae bacterium]